MKKIINALLFILAAGSACAQTVQVRITNADKSALFSQQAPLQFTSSPSADSTITVNDGNTFQTIDGFGFALTGGSAQLMIGMPADKRKQLIDELFRFDKDNIGISYLRLSIGASDMNDHVFTYDDLPDGETDTALAHFTLDQDRKDVIPVLKEILKVDPSIKIMGTPWTAPAWMKTNNKTQGGKLKKEYYPAYAKYFVRYINDMKKEGIDIDAVTLQNEPYNGRNTPSLQMFPDEQLDFLKNHVGPLFKRSGIKTKIILFDHNCDSIDYPETILSDPAAAKYADGSGFHLYRGSIDALTKVHNAYPDKNLYFTEQMVIERYGFTPAVYVSRLTIGAPRNWTRNVILWNLAADKDSRPHTDNGGCPFCQGAITIDSGKVTSRNIAYYVIAHAAKYVRPGSVRIESNNLSALSNVAFKTPANKKVLIVANTGKTIQHFNIAYNGKLAAATLDAGAVGTYSW